MPKVLYQEFRDEYEYTAYPFCDGASLADDSGAVVIPPNIFLDGAFFIPGVTDALYLATLTKRGQKLTFDVSDPAREHTATATLDPRDGVLRFHNPAGWYVGCLVSTPDRLPFFLTLKDGTYHFYPEDTPISARCIQPVAQTYVSSIDVGDSRAVGDVWLVGGEGVTLREEDGCIRIDLVGELLPRQLFCADPDAVRMPRLIQAINGIGPDAHGEILLTGSGEPSGTVLRVITHEDHIEITTL